MNAIHRTRPFLDGKIKRMFIGGKWLEAVSGKTFPSHNPSTGELLANVAEGDAEDIDRAVRAAREAFNGPWSKFKPAQRQHLLLKLADLVEQNIEELAALDTLDMGAPISRTRNNKARAVGMRPRRLPRPVQTVVARAIVAGVRGRPRRPVRHSERRTAPCF